MVGDVVRDCGGTDFFTFFPGSSRMVGICVGVAVSLGDGDPAGVFAGAHPFCNFRPGMEPFLDTGTPTSSGAGSFLIITESCRFAISGEGTTPLPGLFLGCSETTLGRLGRVAPTLETGPSGLFLEPGILQRKDRSQRFSPLRLRDTGRQGYTWASKQGKKSIRGPRALTGFSEPHRDPLHPKNLRDALEACSEGTESSRARPQGTSKPKSPKTHHPE